MNTEQKEPEYTEIIDDDDPPYIDLGEASAINLYDELIKNEAIIVTIPSDQLGILRKSIADTKYRTNQALIKKNIAPDIRRIVFEQVSKDTDGLLKIRIRFKTNRLNIVAIEKEQI